MDAIDWAHHADYVWLIAAVSLMTLETVGITGVGLVFSGLGALVAGAAVHFGAVGNEAYVGQFIIFFIATALWSFLLWKPLQKIRLPKAGHEYRNIVGDTAYVGSNGLNKKTGGEVTWSGTIMNAQLVANAPADSVEAGSQVEVVDVKGATLIVRPKA